LLGNIDISTNANRLLGIINISDNENRKLGYVKNIPEAFIAQYDYLLVSNNFTKLLFPGKFKIGQTFMIENIKRDNGNFSKTIHIFTPYKIHYVYDNRHSHDLDLEDTTEFSHSNTNATEVLKIDYGQIINSTFTYIRFALGTSNYTGYCTIQISVDNSNWTQIGSASRTGVYQTFEITAENINFRYIRFLTNISASGATVGLKVLKIVIITDQT